MHCVHFGLSVKAWNSPQKKAEPQGVCTQAWPTSSMRIRGTDDTDTEQPTHQRDAGFTHTKLWRNQAHRDQLGSPIKTTSLPHDVSNGNNRLLPSTGQRPRLQYVLQISGYMPGPSPQGTPELGLLAWNTANQHMPSQHKLGLGACLEGLDPST